MLGCTGTKVRSAKPQPAALDTTLLAAETQTYQKLKAAADALMDAGEMDVYELKKEDLQRGAALYAPMVR